METINIEDILDPEKRKKKKEELLQKLTHKDIEKLKELAKGGKEENIKEVEDARYALFLIGEIYTSKEEKGKNFWERMGDRIGVYAERKIPFMKEKIYAGAIAEEEERYADILKRSKEEDRPTNLKELRPFILKKKIDNYLEILRIKYENDPDKIKEIEAEGNGLKEISGRLKPRQEFEKLNEFLKKHELIKFYKENRDENPLVRFYYNEITEKYDRELKEIDKASTQPSCAKRIEKVEKLTIGGKIVPGLLKEYNPALYKTARRVNKLKNVKKLARIPSMEKALLEVGRPDLVYGPEKLTEYIKKMDREGLPVSKLSAEVWKCSKAIDALSEPQLFELATEGNAAAQEYLRHNIVKNPWLLVGNKNPGGKYEPRRGTGISKFALMSALKFEVNAFAQFLKGAKEIMPAKGKNSYDEWVKELLSKYTGEDVLGWDIPAFEPTEIRKGTFDPNCAFMLFTRYAHPTQLGLIPPTGVLAEKRKPIATEALIKYKDDYEDENTKRYIGELEKVIHGTPEEKTIEEKKTEIERLKKDLEEVHEKLETRVDKEELARDLLIPLGEFDELTQRLSDEEKRQPLYQELKNICNFVMIALKLKKIELREGESFSPERHETESSYAPGESKIIKRVIKPGYKLDDRVIKKPKVELK
jgi:molecular chaperone GrpE (heat shock protein)